MKWITRERPKIDRIACPWLIKNFVDPGAEFLFVPAAQVVDQAEALNAIPYDITGVEYTHEGERCTSLIVALVARVAATPPRRRRAASHRGHLRACRRRSRRHRTTITSTAPRE